MATSAAHPLRRSTVLAAVALATLISGPAGGQILPWEVTVAEIESGRLRHLSQRLSKQNVLYQLRLGDQRKDDLIATASQIDRIIASLEEGSSAYSIPAPWTKELAAQVRIVDRAWGPLRRLAIADPYDYLHLSRQFAQREDRRGDPLMVRFFDGLSQDFIAESEKLLQLYHEQCTATGLEICETARSSGYAAMLMERAAKEAVYVVAGIDARKNRKRLRKTVAAYLEVRRQNDANSFFAEALNPERGPSARGAGQLLVSLREDWDEMEAQIELLSAGDEKNFDLRPMLEVQTRLVEKVERLTAALVRYASLTYGS